MSDAPQPGMETQRSTDIVTKLLIIVAVIGALNWGLIGFFNFNLVDAIFGGGAREETTGLSRVVYALVGLAALALAVLSPRFVRGPTRQPV